MRASDSCSDLSEDHFSFRCDEQLRMGYGLIDAKRGNNLSIDVLDTEDHIGFCAFGECNAGWRLLLRRNVQTVEEVLGNGSKTTSPWHTMESQWNSVP